MCVAARVDPLQVVAVAVVAFPSSWRFAPRDDERRSSRD